MSGMGPTDLQRSLATIALVLTALLLATATGCTSFQGEVAYRSAGAALGRGQTELAISELQRAAELMPANSEIRNQLGLAHVRVGQLDQAAREFERAVWLDCGNRAAAENLAVARAQQSRQLAEMRMGAARREGP